MREFMLGRYRQYLADQKRLQQLEEINDNAERLLSQHDELCAALSQLHTTLLSLRETDLGPDYREAIKDVLAIFVVVIGPHLRVNER